MNMKPRFLLLLLLHQGFPSTKAEGLMGWCQWYNTKAEEKNLWTQLSNGLSWYVGNSQIWTMNALWSLTPGDPELKKNPQSSFLR